MARLATLGQSDRIGSMTTGSELLAFARSRPAGASLFQDTDDRTHRSALIAALVSSYTPADRDLIRLLTEGEMAHRTESDGSGNELLACCWMLFRIGDVADSALVWKAKNLDFDTYCSIDSVFLVPHGVEVTVRFARENDLPTMAEWVSELSPHTAEAVARWRSEPYFLDVPAASESVEVLADWIQW